MALCIRLLRIDVPPVLIAVLAIMFLLGSEAMASETSTPLPWMIGWDATSDTPGWNRTLHIEATREGCSAPPGNCVSYFKSIMGRENVSRAIVSFVLGQEAPDYATAYSNASVTNNWLYSIGIDDFVAVYTKLAKQSSDADALSILAQTIKNAHSANPKLKFGITIYESELNSNVLDASHFPPQLRAQVDLVHLYLAYRRDANSMKRYVDQAAKLFPHAGIVGGLYPYDREDYLPCQLGSSADCSAKDDLELFLQNVRADIKLLRSGRLVRLEFAPGHLGNPTGWTGWEQWRICHPWRRSTCENNSLVMQQDLRALLAPSGK